MSRAGRLVGAMRHRLQASPLSTSFSVSLAIQALTVVTGVVLARSLGPAHRGELAAILLWPTLLATIGSLGVTQAMTYYSARGDDRPDVLLATSLRLGLIQSFVLMAVGVLVVRTVLGHLGTAAVHMGYLFLLFIPLNLLTLFVMALLNGRQRYVAFHFARFFVVFAIAVGLVVLALLHRLDVMTGVATYLVANALTLLTVLINSLRLDGTRLSVHWHRELARRIWIFGLKSHSGSVSSTLNQRLDQLLISVFLSPARLGVYVVAVTLTSFAVLLGTSVAMVALPAISSLAPGPQRTSSARRFVTLTLVLGSAVTLPLIAVTPQLIKVFFGTAFLPATNVCRVLLVGSIVLAVNRTLTAVLTGVGRPLAVGVAETIALGVTCIGLGALLPTLGLMGAALASLAAYSVSSGYMVWRAARALEITPLRLLVPARSTLILPGAEL